MSLCFRMIITKNSDYCAIPIKPSDKLFYWCQLFTVPQPILRSCEVPVCPSKQIQGHYDRNNSTKFPAPGAGRVSEPRLMSEERENARNRVRVDQCVSAVRAVEVSVYVCLRSSCNHVTEACGPQGLWDSCWGLSSKMTGLGGCNPAISQNALRPFLFIYLTQIAFHWLLYKPLSCCVNWLPKVISHLCVTR
jgi:hypothetical protein